MGTLSAKSFEVDINEEGKIIDFLSGSLLEPRPEEHVRQTYLKVLHHEYQYPKEVLGREVAIYHGSKEVVDSEGRPVRADIVIYSSSKACSTKDQGKIELIIECKAPNEKKGYNQLVSYIFNTSASGGVWYNGNSVGYYRRIEKPKAELVEWIGIPRKNESWDALGRRRKTDLIRPKDIKGLLRRCHNKLHGRGIDGEEEDLTLDMVRIILAKAMDEEQPGEYPEFYCTPEEYINAEGIAKAASRIRALFSEVVEANPDVFGEHEKISVGDRAVCDVVVELQPYKMLSDLNESEDWDIMGYAYEQYTATYFKRTKGQFFTNRLAVDLMVKIIDPNYKDLILDPAGGSGGFLTGAMRYVRRKILNDEGASQTSKQRQLDRHRTNLFMVEISKRLVKIAKTAMILNGDGHTGMTQGDSLGKIDDLNENVRARAGLGKPTVILTNPPFAGVGEGRITEAAILDSFNCGIKWTKRGGSFTSTGERNSEGVPPEMVFFERCLQWVAPGGRIGIVMPKSFLDTLTYYPVRKLLMDKYKVLAVINCHKDTFQPHTGVRTCLVFVEKPKDGVVEKDYSIFMGISRKIGQDSEGYPIFKRDKDNLLTDEVDHDLDVIYSDYCDFKEHKLKSSEYRFSVKKSEIDSLLRINPQAYLPNLNETIRKIESIDGKAGWSVSTLSQSVLGIRVFKGARLKSENIITDKMGPSVEPYYTPSAVLQEKGDSAKLFDLSLATGKQKSTIEAIRVKRGDIVISRSGTVGRVSFITNRLHNAIVSDDLIRIKIHDEDKRLYIYAFMQSEAAYHQMIRNEYGAVQQHLEPQHVSDILIPIPDNWDDVNDIIEATRRIINLKEEQEIANKKAEDALDELFVDLMAGEEDKEEE